MRIVLAAAILLAALLTAASREMAVAAGELPDPVLKMELQALQLEMETARLWTQLSFLAPDERLIRDGFPSGEGKRKAGP